MNFETVLESINADGGNLDPTLRNRDVGSFAIDSRSIGKDCIFLALSQPEYRDNGFNGDFADSTIYVPTAFENGAIAAVVRRDRFEEHREMLEPFSDRLIFVDDAIAELQSIAHRVNADWGGKVVAITGSAGKTTAKELTAHVLAGKFNVLRNIKNYNNGLGLPLTVFELLKDPSYEVAVLEMGMSTPMNEIRRLCAITPPDVSTVLGVLPVHLEHLKTIENIRAAKAEIVEGMKTGGTAVLNADDERVVSMANLANGNVITFGIENPADVMATEIRSAGFASTEFVLNHNGESATVRLPLVGKHNVSNALSAAAVGISFGSSVGDIADRLSSSAPPPQRGEVVKLGNGATIINDSYNSNPDALIAMVRTLVDGSPARSRKIVIAGEMLELGPDAADIHFRTGAKIADLGIDRLIGVRGFAENLIAGARSVGFEGAEFVASPDEAGELVAGAIESGDCILVKGSRGVKTEVAVNVLTERFAIDTDEQ